MRATNNIIGFGAFVVICGTALSTVFAQEALPDHVTDTVVAINKRVDSIEVIDAKMKPLKEELRRMQDIRDLLDADLRDDAKSLDRWNYEYNWETRSATLRSSASSESSSSSELPKADQSSL